MAIQTFYPYDPNRVLPIVFGALVFILSVSILYQCLRRRWYHFGIGMFWAALVWVAGFIIREISVFNQLNLGLFVAQYVLIFAGPPLFATSETFILGRLLAYLPYHTPIHPGRVIYVFILMGVAIEALAINGAAVASNSNASAATRESAFDRIKASLILQEVLELFFFSLVSMVEYRCRKAGHFPRNVKIMCRLLYTTSLMMMVRCIVRTVEGFQSAGCNGGACSPVISYEWYQWVFEVANITVFIAALAIWHPSRYLPSNEKRYLDPKDGVTERMGPGFTAAQNRSRFSTWIDPLDFAGMIQGRKHDKFWERDNEIAEGSFAASKGSKESIGHKLNPFSSR